MAENLDDGEFWLPSQFLIDDDDDDVDDVDNRSFKKQNPKIDNVFEAAKKSLFLYLSSGSETESDEEDHLAELTSRVALQLDLHNSKPKPKGLFGGGSPQSTLSAFGSSGKGSSPKGAVSQANDSSSTFDLLRAAAGEVERMRLSEEDHRRYGYNFLRHNNAPKPNGVNQLGFYNSQQQQLSLSQQQLQISQFQLMRQQQQQRQMVPNRGKICNNNNVRGGNNIGLGLSATAWPHGSGMGAVFLAGKRESTGTGVFLPRVHEPPKKQVCNTVLVPDRVAKALNLNLDGVVCGELNHHHQRHHHQRKHRVNGENGSAVTRVKRNNNNSNCYGYSYQKHNNNLKLQQPHVMMNHEIHLPLEWTY